MLDTARSRMPDIIARYERPILDEWLKRQSEALGRRRDLLSDQDLERQSAVFLSGMRRALSAGELEIGGAAWRK